MANESPSLQSSKPSGALQQREPDGLYQENRLVARVVDPEVDTQAKEIRFAEVYNSDELILPEECEFQKYRILIQRVAYASKVNKEAPHKGRILREVAADLLGYREQ